MASTVRSDPVGSVIGFAIVFVSFVFRGFSPAPTWVWLVVLAVGALLAVKDGISGLDVVTLALAGFMIVGSLMSVANTPTSYAPDLRKLNEPIPVPAEYGFRLDGGLQRDFERMYRSKPISLKTVNQAIEEVVDYYIAGLPPEWTVVDRKEDLRIGDTLYAQAKFRQGDTSNGIGIQVLADVYADPSPAGRSAAVILIIQALNCGEDVQGLPSSQVC
jgi:hypothetical protein